MIDCDASLFFEQANLLEKTVVEENFGAMTCVKDIQIRGDSSAIHASELVFMLETSGGVADLTSARLMLKGKAIAVLFNERVVDETSWESPTKEQSRFMYIPIHTLFAEDYRLKLNPGSMQKRQSLFWPFYSFEEEDFDLFSIKHDDTRVLQRDNTIAAVSIVENAVYAEYMFLANNTIWGHLAFLGGFAIVLYYILGMFVCCCTSKKFENYLASELYMATEAVVNAEGQEVSEAPESDAGCCGGRSMLSRYRHHIPARFYNAIFDQEAQILNRSEDGCMRNYLRCLCPRRRVERIFMKARRHTAEELNITSMIKAQR